VAGRDQSAADQPNNLPGWRSPPIVTIVTIDEWAQFQAGTCSWELLGKDWKNKCTVTYNMYNETELIHVS
jgi:hypothetical protein